MVRLKAKVGRTQVEVEAQGFKEICAYSSLLGSMPTACTNCKSENIYLNHKDPKGNDYFGLKCGDCGAELTFHQKKNPGNGSPFYVRYDDKFEKYQGGGGDSAPSSDGFKDDNPGDSIPF